MSLSRDQEDRLVEFVADNEGMRKGLLCVALVVTRRAQDVGLPMNEDSLLTVGGGQVRGLGRAAVQSILNAHGITRVLAQEGGRTSRGSVGLTKAYAQFLNCLHHDGNVDLQAVESWWVARVREFFAAQPFVLNMDPNRSIRFVVQDLLRQAEQRQAEASGVMIVGAVLQHLVGAKLALLLGEQLPQHGASVADEPTGRTADFQLHDTAVHVTVAPTEALLKKCRSNLEHGLHVIIITVSERTSMAEGLAQQEGIGDRVDVLDAEQFIAANLHERGKFDRTGRTTSAVALVEKYNEIVETCETDPSLRIAIA